MLCSYENDLFPNSIKVIPKPTSILFRIQNDKKVRTTFPSRFRNSNVSVLCTRIILES